MFKNQVLTGNEKDTTLRSAPQRSCVACRQVQDKRQLIRLVKLSNGEIAIDMKGKKPGRGAYLCPKFSCWQEGLKKDRLERALRTSITKEQRQHLLEYGQSLSTGSSSED